MQPGDLAKLFPAGAGAWRATNALAPRGLVNLQCPRSPEFTAEGNAAANKQKKHLTAQGTPGPGDVRRQASTRRGKGAGDMVGVGGQSPLLLQIKPVKTRLLGKLELGMNFSF